MPIERDERQLVRVLLSESIYLIQYNATYNPNIPRRSEESPSCLVSRRVRHYLIYIVLQFKRGLRDQFSIWSRIERTMILPATTMAAENDNIPACVLKCVGDKKSHIRMIVESRN